MSRATETLRPTVEEHLRSARRVLQLVADLFDLQTVAPDYARQGLSSAAVRDARATLPSPRGGVARGAR